MPSLIVIYALCSIYVVCIRAACLYELESDGWSLAGHRGDAYSLGYAQDLAMTAGSGLMVAGHFDVFSPRELYIDIASIDVYRDRWIHFPNITRPATAVNSVYGINKLAVNGTMLYVGGVFQYAQDAVVMNSIALIRNLSAGPTADEWSALQMGVDGEVNSLAIFGSYLLVGGVFPSVNGSQVSSRNFAIWDDSIRDWTPWCDDWPMRPSIIFSTAMPGHGVNADGIVYVSDIVGNGVSRLLLSTNGMTYRSMNTNIAGYVFAMAYDGTQLYVGGRFSSINNSPFQGLARYTDKEGWRVMGGGGASASLDHYVIYALHCNGTDSVYAGGVFDTIADVKTPSLARYDIAADSWTGVPPGFYGLVKTLAVNGSTLYVGVWKYTPLADQPWITTIVVVLISVFLGLLLVLLLYFIVVRCLRKPMGPRQTRFSQFFSTIICLLCVANVALSLDHPGVTNTISTSMPWMSLEQADNLRLVGEIVEYAVAGCMGPFVGYLTNHLSTRVMLTCSMVLSAVASVLQMFVLNSPMYLASRCFNGLAYSVSFVSALAYYARASYRYAVGPMLAFFYAKRSVPTFLNAGIGLMYEYGLNQQITAQGVFSLAMAAVLILLVWIGFREQPLDSAHLLSLREQFRIRWLPVVILLALLAVVNVAAITFEFMPTFYIHTHGNMAIFIGSTFAMATVILIAFVMITYWGQRGPAFLAVLCTLLFSAGYVTIVVCMFTLPNTIIQISGYSQQYAFFVGSVFVSSTGNLVQAIIAALFVGIITQTSKGTLVGIFAFVGILSRFCFAQPVRVALVGYGTQYVSVVMFSCNITVRTAPYWPFWAPLFLLPFSASFGSIEHSGHK
eukprot:TRINITY_DN1478_c0_g1_i4.p1 TRINITY_DN1478_c0_g1~~TRINITY_DN1478_c0_g1_i4.p1  ORF type:complete len:844 (-),score=144.01 TRINITY_DN1478_c0_g1_i4:1297-3828(-)